MRQAVQAADHQLLQGAGRSQARTEVVQTLQVGPAQPGSDLFRQERVSPALSVHRSRQGWELGRGDEIAQELSDHGAGPADAHRPQVDRWARGRLGVVVATLHEQDEDRPRTHALRQMVKQSLAARVQPLSVLEDEDERRAGRDPFQ